VTNMRMFSDASLDLFRRFVQRDTEDRFISGVSNKCPGAFDETYKELKRRMARDAQMESTGASMLDPDTIQAILKVVSEAHGEDSTAQLMNTIHAKYPGACGDMAEPDDTAMDDDPEDFSPAAQFAKSAKMRDEYADGPEGAKNSQAMDLPPAFKGRPTPGGKMVAQDARLRFANAERLIKSADEYNEFYKDSAARIRVI
jgi:hypothetical protein